jgi:UDP-N-acetylmuramoyl-tripeptide--D-alanyl-D-alanine ligase
VKPSLAVITSIGPSHLVAYKEMSRIVEEKISLLWALPKNGIAVLNLDDENVRKASYGGRWAKMTYAIDQQADLMATDISTILKNGLPQTKFKIKGKINLIVMTHMIGGRAQVYASLAAVAVGQIMGLTVDEIQAGLKKLTPEKHRMEIFAGIKGSTIIDDSYNASPLSVHNALEVLKNLNSLSRKIVVLGDMRELGDMSLEAHKAIGDEAAKIADIVIAVGDLARKYKAHKYFKNRDKAIQYLLKEVCSNDILLIKASRAIGLDKVADALRA